MHQAPEAYQNETLEHPYIDVFSLSKFLSFSGSRVGYGLVRDPELAHYMRYFIITSTHGLAGDGQIRCLAALKYLLAENHIHSYTQ